jgi:mitotic spindle assembly checkpoint protein MAD1
MHLHIPIHIRTHTHTDDNNKSVVRLRSVYAEREDDELLFQWAQATGELELMESDFGKRVDPHVFAYLSNFNSFPAFLAALTMDLFEKQTMQ